jgi:hypothetical protein
VSVKYNRVELKKLVYFTSLLPYYMKILGCGFLLLLPSKTSEFLSKSAMLIGSSNNKRDAGRRSWYWLHLKGPLLLYNNRFWVQICCYVTTGCLSCAFIFTCSGLLAEPTPHDLLRLHKGPTAPRFQNHDACSRILLLIECTEVTYTL